MDYSHLKSQGEPDQVAQQQNKEGAVYTATARPTATGTHTEQNVRPIEEKEVAACHTRSGISSSNIPVSYTHLCSSMLPPNKKITIKSLI